MKIIVIKNIRSGQLHFLTMDENYNQYHVLRKINEAFDWVTQEDEYEIVKEIRA